VGWTPGTFTSRGRWDQDSVAVSASPASAERPLELLGQHFSVARRDLLAITASMNFTRAGCGEDSDIQYRMSLLGVSGKSLRNLAIQYHIWHPLTKHPNRSRLRFLRRYRRPVTRLLQLGIFPLRKPGGRKATPTRNDFSVCCRLLQGRIDLRISCPEPRIAMPASTAVRPSSQVW